MSAFAIANNDVVQIVWQYEAKIAGCLGFAIFRKQVPNGPEVPLPAWVGFQGQNNPAWTQRTTQEWPVQKFEWKDLTATRGLTYSYRIVPTAAGPTSGSPLQLMDDRSQTTNAVTLTPVRGSFSTYFNRGILSTQALSHSLPTDSNGRPSVIKLTDFITTPGSWLRNSLAGQIIDGVELLLKRAASDGGSCYLALYELNDPELVSLLVSTENLHVVLSNSDTDGQNVAGSNPPSPARQQLHAHPGIEIFDRTVPSGHIGHNKFCVYVDPNGVAQAVLLGSTNWTDTGLCAQSNNALVVEDATLAQEYLNYWKLLCDDTLNNNSKQGVSLRSTDAMPKPAIQIDGAEATIWFSPNTPKARAQRPSGNEPTPPDLEQLFELMSNAQQAIMFLEFEPGKPSVVDQAAKCLNANPNLFVRGAVTAASANNDYVTTLTHRGGDQIDVVTASGINDQFAYWQRELATMGHAIVHSKIVVIDPMSKGCVVATGSHNQGFRASYNNDENLLIVQGHADLTRAYAVNVMDVYDHYRFRYQVNKQGTSAFSGLIHNDTWQDPYFAVGSPQQKDHRLWFPCC